MATLLLLAVTSNGAGPYPPLNRTEETFERTPAERVQQELERILAQPEYRFLSAPETSSLSRWLGRKMHALMEWVSRLARRSPFLFWFIVIWLLATLVAILAHLLYVLLRLVVRGGAPIRRERRRPEVEAKVLPRRPGPQQLLEQARKEARAGRYLEAVRLFYLGLILFLDGLRKLRFHESKTNGDYVAELIRTSPGAQCLTFQKVTRLYERVVYGREPCSAEVLQRMWSMSTELGLTGSEARE